MNIVDSSGWLEYFGNGKNANFFASAIEQKNSLIVPTIILTEVFRRILQQRDEQFALQVAAHMKQNHVVNLDADIALKSAKIGFEQKLPLADSIIWATTQKFNAVLWTQDEDFKNFKGVRYVSKVK